MHSLLNHYKRMNLARFLLIMMRNKSKCILLLILLIIIYSQIFITSCKGSIDEVYPSRKKLDRYWNNKINFCFYNETKINYNKQACIQILLKYLKFKKIPSQDDITNEINDTLKNHNRIITIFDNRNIDYIDITTYNKNVDIALHYLKSYVSNMNPIMVYTKKNILYNDSDKYIYRIITGYNETGIFFHDTNIGPNQYLNNNEFTDLWKTDYGYWAVVFSKTKEYILKGFINWFITNLDIISLFIIGVSSEIHYPGRLAIFSNSIALDLFFIKKGFTPWWIVLYLVIGTFLGLTGLLAYIVGESLPSDYYGFCFIYIGSITTALIMLIGTILL